MESFEVESSGIGLNHEIWAVCPVCGCEYDARIWGDTCPECARRKAKEIRQMARYPMTVKANLAV